MRRTAVGLFGLVFLLSIGAVGGVIVNPSDTTNQQTPTEQWNQTYDGPGRDIFSSITPTSDGRYLLTGYSERNGSDDGWMVMVDANGEKQWELTAGGNGTDRLYGAIESPTGGYLVAGRTDVDDRARGWLLKVEAGRVVWNRTIDSHLGGIREISRGESGIIVAGWTWSDGRAGWLANIDEQGTVLWERALRDDARIRLKALVTEGNGILVAGIAEDANGSRGWVGKTSSSGEIQWNRSVGKTDGGDVWAAARIESGYVLAGESGGVKRAQRDAWVVTISENGSVERSQTFGGDGYDWFDSATSTDDGILFTGGTMSGGIGSADGFVIKLGPTGNEKWRTVVGTPRWDKSWPTIVAHDGSYLLAGQTGGYETNSTGGWLVSLAKPGDTRETEPSSEANSPTQSDSHSREETTQLSSATGSNEPSSKADGGDGGPSWHLELFALIVVVVVVGVLAFRL